MASPNLKLYNLTDDTEITAINYGTGDAGDILPTSAGTEYHLWNDKGAVLESDAAVAIRVSARDSNGQEVEPITTQKWVEVKSTTIHAGTDGGSITGYTDDNMSDFEPVGENAYVLIGNIPSDCYRKLFIRVNIPPSAEQIAVTFSIYITPQYLSQGIADYITDIHGDGVLPTGDMCEVTDNAAADSVIDIASGVALINDNAVLVYAQSKTLPTDAGTYKVYITLDGVISYTTTTIPTNSIELAEVVIAASVVDSVSDSRVFISNVRSTIADTDKFLKSSGTGASFAELTEADISDLGTYLEDITSESIGDLSDVDLTSIANEKMLQYNSISGNWECVDAPSGGSGYTNLTSFVDQTAWRVFYSDTSGDVTELALGSDGTYLKSNGASAAPTWATPSGSGDVSKVGTPVDSQVGVWTGDGTIEGDTSLTFDTSTDVLSTGGLTLSGLTASEIVGTDASKNLVSLAVATYPSLTELSYVKGVSSAIQTQLGDKLEDITGESIGDLSDVDLTDIADTKILQYNAITSKWECETAPSGSGLSNVVEDTTPELGGELDAGANSIGFTLQTVAEADGTTTIDWKLGNHCKVTLGAQNETFTFTAPSNPCTLTLILVQDATGGRDITWPGTVKWLGTEATWTDGGAGKGIVVGFIYDGTNYWGQATPWES